MIYLISTLAFLILLNIVLMKYSATEVENF